MLKVSDALSSLINDNATLHFALHHRLLNLSQLARFLKPLVEARVKKQVTPSAILMALSRLQGNLPKSAKNRQPKFQIQNMNIQSELCILTYEKTRESHRGINELFNRLQKTHGYITITEGVNEITVIVEKVNFELATTTIAARARYSNSRVASITVKFDQRYLNTPGFLYLILQQIAMQNINILELASTTTELVLYLDREDIRLAFDTLYNRFVSRA